MQLYFHVWHIVFLPDRCRHDEPRLLARRVRAPSKKLILLNIVVCRILRYFEETTLPVKTLLEKSKAKQYPSNWYLAHQPQSEHWGSQKKIKEKIEHGVLLMCSVDYFDPGALDIFVIHSPHMIVQSNQK